MNLLSLKNIYLFLFISVLFITCKPNKEINIAYPEGGYPYPKNISSEDSNFYFLPIQKRVGRRDSITICCLSPIYSGFNEQNLSLESPTGDIFRFVLDGWDAMITLQQNKIEVKELTSSPVESTPDENKLDSIEKLHYGLFDVQYQLSDEKFPKWKRKSIDSLLKLYPQLFDPGYYLKLVSKVYPYKKQFDYTKKETKISGGQFKQIVNLINKSGYWDKAYYSVDCDIIGGEGVFIEAIVKRKYQCIFYKLCPEDSSDIKNAYNLVLKYGAIENGKLGRQDTVPVRSNQKVEVRELNLTELKEEKSTSEPKKKKS